MNINIKPYGRLGNFIIQLKNAIHIGLFYNYNIVLPTNKFFNTTYIVINTNISFSDRKFINDTFFFKDTIKNIDTTLFEKNKDKVITIMKQIFIFNNVLQLGNKKLVIHIRSGDIFSKNPATNYVMPPLSYYTNIIAHNAFDEIYLIAENRKNPCINRLLELFPKIRFRSQSLEEDVKLILSANNVVMSFGTFIPQLMEFSNNINTLYSPSYCYTEDLQFTTTRNCTIHKIDLEDYHRLMFPWKNTEKQKETMLTYICKS